MKEIQDLHRIPWLTAAVVLGATFASVVTDRPAVAAGSSNEAVPATIGAVQRQTAEIELSGLGTVQAWQSVVAKAQVNGYLATIDFREGQAVKKGDLLATVDPRPYAATLAEALARKASDAANLANDQLNYSRDSKLATKGFQTEQQADNDIALVREYTANIQGDEASIAAARLNLDFCNIKAPVDGVVGFRQVDLGNLIEASAETPIVTIEQVQPIAVVFTLPEQDFEPVEQAIQHTRLAVLATSADQKTVLDTGTLVASDNQIATSTGTISLKAIFANPKRTLWPGQYVQARLQLRREPDTIVVSDDAVQHGPDGLFVYTVASDMTVHQQPITVGDDNGTRSTVTSGLQAGQQIVLAGQSRLQNGSRIQPSSPSNPNSKS